MKLRVVPLVAILLICGVVLGCDFLNPLKNLATGDFLLSPVDTDINAPDWLEAKRLVGTTGYSTNIIELSAATGAILATHVVDDTTISRMNTIDASPDRSLVVFQVHYKGPTYEVDDGELEYSDIIVYNLAADEATTLTDGGSWFNGASFLSNTEVVYIEYDYSAADEVSNRIIKHNLTTDVATVIVEFVIPVVGGETQGDTYWWSQALPGSTKVLVCASEYATGEVSFAVFDTGTGAKLVDGFAVESYDIISKGDWIDEDTIIIATGSDATSQLVIINTSTSTVVQEMPIVDPAIHRLYGLHLSPDKTMVASHAQELDANQNHVGNQLIVVRIAAAAE
jgi:hypothetical protein